jgi:hypothetical protein
MAREESPREDLLREATAFVERIELAPGGQPSNGHVVAGFRADGAMSIFFGEDPVYQFNAAGQLRRAFCDCELYKAIGGRLVSLRRVRQDRELQLLRHELASDEQETFLAQMRQRLSEFVKQLDGGQMLIVGQVPADVDVLGRVRQWFAEHDSIAVARHPHAGARVTEGR